MYHNPLFEDNKYLLNEYIKNGGSMDLVCIPSYFNGNLKEKSLIDMYQKKKYNYTKEELDLHKRMLYALKNEVLNNQDELQRQKCEKDRQDILTKRLERRLEKSRNR